MRSDSKRLIGVALFIGLGATVFLDLVMYFSHLLIGTKLKSYGLVGRWIIYMLDGVFVHENIKSVQAVAFEQAVGWTFHYLVGILFASVFLWISKRDWTRKPTLIPAILFGCATVVFPFFILQPSFGAGIAATKTSDPITAQISSIASHFIFGLGLYISAQILTCLQPYQTKRALRSD